METVVHLTASRFFGGPERQMLELARELSGRYRTVFVSFSEGGNSSAFLGEVGRHKFTSIRLKQDTPHFIRMIAELTEVLRSVNAQVVCCHGYKADIIGYCAGRALRLPVVAVSRGWTHESTRVRLYEMADKWVLAWMDHVVCVSESQADKVRKAGVEPGMVTVIKNAIRTERFEKRSSPYRRILEKLFPDCRYFVGAIGRISPEKGFDVLARAVAHVLKKTKEIGFVHYGDGPLRRSLSDCIVKTGTADHFRLMGFSHAIEDILPALDLVVVPSFTEGLPNVVLEAFAAGVPVIGTRVGGIPEVLEDGVSGRLVPPGDAVALSNQIIDLAATASRRAEMGEAGRQRVRSEYSFSSQADQYEDLFRKLLPRPRHSDCASPFPLTGSV